MAGGIGNRTLVYGDNIDVLRSIEDGRASLVYLDPPFNKGYTLKTKETSRFSGKHSFADDWREVGIEGVGEEDEEFSGYLRYVEKYAPAGSTAYLVFMFLRLKEVRRVLQGDGSVFLHCDFTASHYLKTLLDMVFGQERFLNELVWCYSGGNNATRYYPRKHDTIFWYSKGEEYIFDPKDIKVPASIWHREAIKKDTKGWYIMVKGKRYYTDRYKIPEDYWTDINFLRAFDKERVGYPTQKPVRLLKRIIQAHTQPGDLVLDPFCGSGTTCIAAELLGREWIGIDRNEGGLRDTYDRLREVVDGEGSLFARDTVRYLDFSGGEIKEKPL